MTEDITPPPQSPDQPASSLTARLTNVLVAPGDVFAEVKSRPVNHANWWVPALLFVVASWIAAAILYSQPAITQQLADAQDKAMQQQFQPQIDSGKMTQAQADQIKAQAAKFAGIGQMVGGFVAPVMQAAMTPFWGGLVVWLGGLLLFRQRFPYLKAVETVGLTMVVLAVGAIVKGLLCTAMGDMFISPGPVLLIKDFDATNAVHTSLLMVDVFVIWGLLLRGIGLAKLADTSFIKASAWVLGVWFLITGGMLVLSLGAQKLASAMTGQH